MEIPYFWFFRWGFRSLVATTGTLEVEGVAAQESGVEGYMGYPGRQGFVSFFLKVRFRWSGWSIGRVQSSNKWLPTRALVTGDKSTGQVLGAV